MYLSALSLVIIFLGFICLCLWVAFCVYIVVTLSRHSTELARISRFLENIGSILEERLPVRSDETSPKDL